MKKRLLALICATVMLFSLVTACSGGSDSNAASTGSSGSSNAGSSGSSNAGSSGSSGNSGAPAPTTDEKFTLICAATGNDESDYYNTPFKEIIEKTSGGRISVEIHNNGTLGTDYELVESTQNGDIHMTFNSTAIHANFVTAAAILDIPFLFDDLDHMQEAAFGDFYTALAEEYAAKGFHLLGFGTQGFRQMSTNTPVHTLDDLKGMKIRTMETPYHLATWKALGCNPTPIAFPELYLALQQGTVVAQENPYENIVNAKLYEQQKYIVETNHIGLLIGWVMNKETYDAMSEELRALVDDAARQVLEKNWAENAERTARSVQTVKDAGLEIITLDPAVLEQFRAATTGTADMVREDVGAETINKLLEALG